MTYLSVYPTWNPDVFASRLILTTTLAIEEPEQHFEIATIRGTINRHKVVAPAYLVDLTNYRLRRE